MLDELADGVVGAVDLVVFGGEGSEEKGGEGGGGEVLGGEAEDLLDLSARINELGTLKWLIAIIICSLKRRWVSMDHPKSEKHEGVAVNQAATTGDISKKNRICCI